MATRISYLPEEPRVDEIRAMRVLPNLQSKVCLMNSCPLLLHLRPNHTEPVAFPTKPSRGIMRFQ